MTLPKTRIALLFAALAGATTCAHADITSPPPKSGLPDFAVASVAFKGKGVSAHTFPISSSAAPVAKLTLGSGTPTGMQGETCQYELTFDAINAGPGGYSAADAHTGVTIGVDIKFPDGSTDNFEGGWYCEGAYKEATEGYDPAGMGNPVVPGTEARYYLDVGVGCQIIEPVVLAVGKTRIAWTFDSDKQVTEYSEANNTFAVDLVVGPKCEPVLPSVKPQSGTPTPIPEGAMQPSETQINMDALKAASSSSRDSLSKALRLGGKGKVIKRAAPRSSARPERKP
jgi:hypothetical protein